MKAENIYKSYGNNKILDDVSYEIERGQTKVIIGPSGSGKSTFLRCLSLLTKPDNGRIWLEDQEITDSSIDIDKVREKIGFVFQHFALFNHLNALRNVSLGLEVVKGQKREIARENALKELKIVGLEEHVYKYPAELSGGQKQRVAIARAIINNPNLLIADEPTGNLDPDTSWDIMRLLRRINERGTTILMATHDKDIVDIMRKRVIALKEGNLIRDELKGVYDHEIKID